jgi:hypothetical protein
MNDNGNLATADERATLLERYGRYYGDEHFAVAFTASTHGDNAKRVTSNGWDKAKPLPGGDYAAGLIASRGQDHNIAVVLRPSNLVVIECDSEQDLFQVEELWLPNTLTVRSSAPYKRHFYFRPPDELGTLPFVAFRFESGKLTADSGRYFLAPPSLHPTGTLYQFLPGLGPGETDIVELPEDLYRALVERARAETATQRDRITVDPDAKIHAGQRRDLIFRYACMLRRWGRPYDAILADCQAFNQERCEPPVERQLVELQVRGAMKKEGDQELAELTDHDTAAVDVIFEPLRAFLQRDLPAAEALVGVARGGTNLLPRYGWVMPWGREGSGKTSVLVDLLFHAATGQPWLGYPIARPLRLVVIVNEGVPGGLQDKFRHKLERWDGDRDQILDNLAIYASPWGEFSFRNPQMVEHAQAYARDFTADYVALDPLHTLGSSGAGAPQDTEQFKHLLRKFGLWDSIGVITAHHSNKLGMVSGDWARHPDTVIHLEKDGKNPATKFTIEKARPADPHELGVPQLLEWDVETFGYRRRDLPAARAGVSDQEILDRIKTTLAEHHVLAMGALQDAVTGTRSRISRVAQEAIKRGEIVNLTPEKQAYTLTLPGNTENLSLATNGEDGEAAGNTPQLRMVEPNNLSVHSTERQEYDPPTTDQGSNLSASPWGYVSNPGEEDGEVSSDPENDDRWTNPF